MNVCRRSSEFNTVEIAQGTETHKSSKLDNKFYKTLHYTGFILYDIEKKGDLDFSEIFK